VQREQQKHAVIRHGTTTAALEHEQRAKVQELAAPGSLGATALAAAPGHPVPVWGRRTAAVPAATPAALTSVRPYV
jgi:hypothetical protein